MNRLVKAAKNTRTNWMEAFKVSMNIHGYAYYDIPDNLRYRYPAPGSCDLAKHDHPNLYKRHWKTPFRDSNLNIRMKEKRMPWADETEHFISEMPSLDPANEQDREYLKQQ
jgi:hypothetical protein